MQSLAQSAHEEHHQDHPHACMGGYIYLGYTYVSEETGDEVEAYEAVPCRRCAEEAAGPSRMV